MELALAILSALASVLPEGFGLWVESVRRGWEAEKKISADLKEAEDELRQAVFSGDVDRITRARRNLDQLQK